MIHPTDRRYARPGRAGPLPFGSSSPLGGLSYFVVLGSVLQYNQGGEPAPLRR